MYSAKPLFNMPANEHTTIWRYMDFTKFVSLLDKKALYFSRPDKLSDKFEGAIPRPTVMARKTLVSGSPIAEDTLKVMSQGAQEVRKFVFLNCWHMNNNESAAMWQLYVQKNEGVAIRSTFARLRESLSSSLFEVFIQRCTERLSRTLEVACLSRSIATVGEPAERILGGHGLQALANGFLQRFMGPGSHASQ